MEMVFKGRKFFAQFPTVRVPTTYSIFGRKITEPFAESRHIGTKHCRNPRTTDRRCRCRSIFFRWFSLLRILRQTILRRRQDIFRGAHLSSGQSIPADRQLKQIGTVSQFSLKAIQPFVNQRERVAVLDMSERPAQMVDL